MVSSTKRETLTFAISLLLLVISLTGVAMAAPPAPPVVASPLRIYPTEGFQGTPGKMARDITGNLYVTDYWKQGVWKFDRYFNKVGFIKTDSRPVGVAVASAGIYKDQLVVTMQAPKAYAAFYSATGVENPPTTNELAKINGTFFRPSGVTVDAAGNIYVVETGDWGYAYSPTVPTGVAVAGNPPAVKVFDAAGNAVGQFGSRSPIVGGGDTTLGRFLEPYGIAYEKKADQIYVADTMNGRVQIFDARSRGTNYAAVGQFGSYMYVSGKVHVPTPQNVSFEYDSAGNLGRIYVTDRAKGRILALDPTTPDDTTKETVIDGTSVTNGLLHFPNDAMFTAGALLVSNAATGNPANIAAFGIDGATVPPNAGCDTKFNPIPPHNMTSNPLAVQGTVAMSSCQVTVAVNGGTPVAAVVNPTTLQWTASVTLASGLNGVVAHGVDPNDASSASDASANTYLSGTLLAAPTLTVTQSPAAYVQTPLVTLAGTTTAATGSVYNINGPVKVDVSVTQGGVAIYSNTITVAGDGSWSAANVPLYDGVNTITLSAWQNGTNSSTPQTFTVTLDTTAPALNGTVYFLPDNSTSAQSVVNINGVVHEKNLQSLTVNDVPVAALAPMGNDDIYFSAPVVLTRGGNTVTVTATDLAGNSTPVAHTVSYNPDLNPSASVAALTVTTADNAYIQGQSSLVFTGKVNNPANYSGILIAGQFPATINADGTWSATTNLRSGFVEYDVVATPVSGTPVYVNRTLDADPSGVVLANLTITDPPADAAVKSASYTVKGQVATTGVSSLTASVDGGTATSLTPAADGTFAFTVTFTAQQNHVVKVTVVQSDGKSSTAIRNIIYDATPPSLSYIASTAATPASLMGNVDASSRLDVTAMSGSTPVTVPVTYDAYDVVNNGIVWHADLTGLTGATFTVTDPAGNVTTRAYAASSALPHGDVDGNGIVNKADVLLALRFVAGSQTPTAAQKQQADVGPVIISDKTKMTVVPMPVLAAPDGIVAIDDCVNMLRAANGLVAFTNQ